ncbi:hypothetical protein NP493_5529g00005 [Ridgeia piscesae]|uniref:Uncharacterized protein n=1 Tax=Ridgeia piscesae TaxID=27915 RepID=A0AAD9MP44_RIDPI|nr:hypothetical protein NP493_5529g00005 [Ridgeia piscesae]
MRKSKKFDTARVELEKASHVEELQGKLRQAELELEEERRTAAVRTTQMQELETLLSQNKDKVEQMKTERTDLIAKSSLQDKLTAAEDRLTATTEQNRQTLDKLNHQLQDARLECQSAGDRCCHLEATLKETGESLQTATQRAAETEADLKTKNELMLNMEATKNSQCADLENQLHMSQHALDENAAMLVKVKGQLEKCW